MTLQRFTYKKKHVFLNKTPLWDILESFCFIGFSLSSFCCQRLFVHIPLFIIKYSFIQQCGVNETAQYSKQHHKDRNSGSLDLESGVVTTKSPWPTDSG